MSTNIETETKNVTAIVTEVKVSPTWDESQETWDQAPGTWNNPGTFIETETKNVTAITNEQKNV